MRTSSRNRDRAGIITKAEWQIIGERFGVPRRQMDVVQAYVGGDRTADDIARRLGLKRATVKTHTARLFENLGAHDRTDVVVLAYREVLILRAAAHGNDVRQ